MVEEGRLFRWTQRTLSGHIGRPCARAVDKLALPRVRSSRRGRRGATNGGTECPPLVTSFFFRLPRLAQAQTCTSTDLPKHHDAGEKIKKKWKGLQYGDAGAKVLPCARDAPLTTVLSALHVLPGRRPLGTLRCARPHPQSHPQSHAEVPASISHWSGSISSVATNERAEELAGERGCARRRRTVRACANGRWAVAGPLHGRRRVGRIEAATVGPRRRRSQERARPDGGSGPDLVT